MKQGLGNIVFVSRKVLVFAVVVALVLSTESAFAAQAAASTINPPSISDIQIEQSTAQTTRKFQNPQRYLQLQNKRITYAGKRGTVIKPGMMGVRVAKIQAKLKVPVAKKGIMSTATVNAVKAYQKKHRLKATGRVNLALWKKLGFKAENFVNMDNATHKLMVTPAASKSKIIAEMVAVAYEYKGRPYVCGGSGSNKYGVDCSGLVLQSLYAVGIDPKPTSSYKHTTEVFGYGTKTLWNNKKLKHVKFANKKRGDLIFYGGGAYVNHVAIYLGSGKIIHSFPGKGVVVAKVSAGGHVVGVSRPIV